MAPSNFLRLFTVLSLAILNISFDALPANALAVEPGHMARGINHAHAGMAKKRGDSKQCKPRPVPSASAPISSTSSTTSPSPKADGNLATPTSTPSSQLSTYKTTTTTSPSSTPSAAASSSGSCGKKKVGLAWSNQEETSLNNFITDCTHYISNWQVTKYPSEVTSLPKYQQLEFVPTIHDQKALAQIPLLTRGYASIVKLYNEPNIPSQANLTPEEGYNLWKDHFDQLTQLGYEFIAPAVTTDPSGFKWLVSFMQLCQGCKFRNIDIHHYGINGDDFTNEAQKFYNQFHMNVWVGEIGCKDYYQYKPCTQDVFDAFYSTVIAFMESTDWIETYSLFSMFTENELPNGVEKVNSMITCPDPNDVSKCHPNSLGYRYLNGS